MSERTTRIYRTSDSYMLSTSGALRLLFIEDLASFTAFDSTLNAAFSEAWNVRIKKAHDTMPDSLIKDVQAGKTEIVMAVMEEAKDLYKELRFFSQKVFKDSLSKQKEFGVADYPKARVNQESMLALLGELHTASTKYATELISGGYSQSKIDAIETLREKLDAAHLEQESYKAGRRTITQERIQILNECYATTKLVIDAAMVVFSNNPARRKAYLYREGSGKNRKKKKEVDE